MNYRIIFVITILLFSLEISGQSFNHSYHSIQSDNPALLQGGFALQLPSVRYTNLSYGPTLSDIIKKNEANEIVFDGLTAADKSSPQNTIFNSLDLETLAISYGSSNWALGIGHSLRTQIGTNYDEDFANIIIFGNAPYIGERLEIGPAILANQWHEYNVSFKAKINKLSIGVRAKLLSGIVNLSTTSSQLSLTTSDDIYQLQFDNNYVLNSSGILEFENFDTYDFDVKNDLIDSFWSDNQGFALDIGFVYDLTARWQLSLELSDLGAINWKENTNTYSSSGQFSFDGIDINDYIGTNQTLVFSDSLNTLLNIVNNSGGFSTRLPPRMDIVAKYLLKSNLQLGAGIHIIELFDQLEWMARLNANYQLNNVFSIGGIYTFHKYNPINVGITGEINLKWLTLFGSVSNVIGVNNILNQNINTIRIGASVHIR